MKYIMRFNQILAAVSLIAVSGSAYSQIDITNVVVVPVNPYN